MFRDLIFANLPALQVLIPLLAAPLCALIPNGRLAWAWALAATWTSFAVTLLLIGQISADTPMTYAMGGWEPPVGIEYRIDTLNAYVLTVLAAIASVIIIFAKESVAKEIPASKQAHFYTVYLLCLAGLFGILSTNDVFNIYVFLEISSLATYTLIAMGQDRRALSASFTYLVIGTLGATFILIGIGLLYMMTGTLNITDLSQRLQDVDNTKPVLAAFAFFIVGLCMKIALFPLHGWLPNAYAYSPSFVSAFLASTATKVGVYVLIRILYSLFGFHFSLETGPLGGVFIFLGIVAVFVGSAIAIFQHNVKKMLAYSSIAQIGYIVIGIGLANSTGLAASIMHIANHALAKGALFMAAGCMAYRLGTVRIQNIRGLARQMPLSTLAFALAGLSIIGVPATAGFISKWYFISALIERGLWPVVILLLISSLMALVYIGRIIETTFFDRADKDAATVTEAPLSMLIPTWILVALSYYFGVDTSFTVGIAQTAADMLMGGAR